jgi:hypothetical protein
LDATLQHDADSANLDDNEATQIGDSMSALQDSLDKLNAGVQDGAFNQADLDAAKENLSKTEAVLMSAADGPGLSDEQANQIGTALDDVFNDLGTLEQSLKGSSAPPPFATRRFARQWLGRRGMRLALSVGR